MARAPKKTDSVYDFLYVDGRRLGVLISQLGGGSDGVLKESRRETKTGSQNTGGVDLHVAKIGHDESESLGLTAVFDPQWLLPLRFLDLVRSKIVRDLSSARLGQIILARGSLEFLDYSLLFTLLGHPIMKQRLASSGKVNWSDAVKLIGLDEGEKNLTPAKAKKAKEDAAELMLSIICSLPRQSQIVIRGDHGKTWSLLRDDSMIVSCDELAMTHGRSMPGEWIVVGLLDGQPETSNGGDNQLSSTIVGGITAPAATDTPAEGFSNSTSAMVSMIKKAVGRPEDMYAITPLMIFREID